MTPQSVAYSASGSCATFGFDFPAPEPDDLEVLLNGAVQTSGFTLLGTGSTEGGAIRFDSAPTAGTAVTIRRTGRTQVSGSDAPGFLEDKIVSGSHITVTKTTDTAGEHLSIATDIDPAQFQPHDADLDWLAANLTGAGKALAGATDAAAQRSALGLGSVAVLDVDTDETLTANSDTLIPSQKAVKTYVDEAVRANVDARDQQALTNIRLLLNSTTPTGTLVRGRQWELASDEWAATSTGQTYVSGSPCCYANPDAQTIVPGSSDWSGSTHYIAGTGTLTSDSPNNASTRTVASYSGDFSATATISGAANVWNSWGIYDAAQDGSYNTGDGAGGTQVLNTAFYAYIQGGYARFYRNGEQQGLMEPFADGDTVKVERVGTTVDVYRNGSPVCTFNRACTASAVKVFYGRDNNAGSQTASGISFVIGSVAANMTLMPPAAISLPTTTEAAYCYFLYKDDSGSAVLGTDLTVELSRDGGTTWTTAALTNVLGAGGFDGTYSFVRARADVSAQPNGSSLTCRIKTLNNKAQRIAAPALYAE